MYGKKAVRLLSQIRLKKPNDDMILQNCVRRIAYATEEITCIRMRNIACEEHGRRIDLVENVVLR